MSRKTNVGTGAATLPQIPSACLICVSSCAIHAPPPLCIRREHYSPRSSDLKTKGGLSFEQDRA